MSEPKWGWRSFARGLELPSQKTMVELAAKGGDDLEHAVSVLLNQNSEEAEILAEELFDAYA